MVTLMMTEVWCYNVDLCVSRLAPQLESKDVVEPTIAQDSATTTMPKNGRRMRELATNVSAGAPRVGPGTAQILRISGFVHSKTGKENGTLFSRFPSDPPQKRSSPKMKRGFSVQIQVNSQKKKGLRCFISMGFIGPSHGPPKIHGPRGHCPPCPPSRRPCVRVLTTLPFFNIFCLFKISVKPCNFSS